MVFLSSLRAEATKLFSTRSIWWTSGVYFALVFASSWIFTLGAQTSMAGMTFMLDPRTVLYALPTVGYPVLAIQAIMVVTTEYRYRMQSVSYTAVPQRWVVVASKFVLYAAIAAALTLVTSIVCLAVARARASAPEAAFELTDSTVWDVLWRYACAAVALVLFSQGIGLLVRHTAGAVGIFLAWVLAGEQILSFLPKVGGQLANWLPFNHLSNFINQGAMLEGFSGVASGGYFLLCATVLFAAGLAVVYRRDA